MASLPSGLGVAAERRGACSITSGVNFCLVLMVIMLEMMSIEDGDNVFSVYGCPLRFFCTPRSLSLAHK